VGPDHPFGCIETAEFYFDYLVTVNNDVDTNEDFTESRFGDSKVILMILIRIRAALGQ
jgi:hypothetical protein